MTTLSGLRRGLRGRLLALAIPLQLALVLLTPMAAAALPPLPGPTPPVIPVPNPFVPAIGAQGAPVAPCRFAGLGPKEIRTLFREGGNLANSFAIDPGSPCHVFRSINQNGGGNGIYRSDASGRAFNQVFTDRHAQSAINNGPYVFSPVMTGAAGNGPAYFYDSSGANGVVYTPDDGASWQLAINGLYSGGTGPTGGITAFAVAPSNPAVAYLAGSVGGQPVIYVTTDSGANWRASGQLQFPVTSLSVDLGNPGHVAAAAGGPATPFGRANLQQWYDSPNYGAGWNTMAGPPGESSPSSILLGGGGRVYAVTGSQGQTAQDITQVTGQKFWRLTPGRAWEQISLPASVGRDSTIAFNPANPNEMMVASALPDGVVMTGSYDGFNSTGPPRTVTLDHAVSGVQLRADRGGDFFLLAQGGGVDQLLALRISALAPDPAPPTTIPGLQVDRKTCTLHDLSAPGLVPGQRSTVYYTSGSIAFDGRLLNYTDDDVGPPGVIYRIDPSSCREQPPLTPPAAAFGGKLLPLFSLTFDPRYIFGNGHVGAILARGGSGAYHDPRIASADLVAVYAVDPNDGNMELAAAVFCGHDHAAVCDNVDPNLFNYDHYLDALWVPVRGDYDVPVTGLARLPARHGANQELVRIPTCMTGFRPPDPNNSDMSMWEPGADGILYVGVEDDVTVLRVNSRTCQYLDGFTHRLYSEGPPKAPVGQQTVPSNETDQMACDAITFGQGAPNVPAGAGTSVLWIRDNALNLVRAYDIAHGFCPFPTTLQLVGPPATGHAGDTVTLCAQLQATTAGQPRPLAGQTIQFSLGGVGLGTGVTDANGRACITTALPNVSGPLNLLATYAGSEAYLPASIGSSLRVTPNGPPPAPPQSTQYAPPAHVAPPNPAIVPAPPPVVPQTQTQAQAQAQTQVQAQAQGQPGVMTEKQKQARVNLARIDGGKQMADIEASRYHAALFAQGTGLGLFALALWIRLRRNRRLRPKVARVDRR